MMKKNISYIPMDHTLEIWLLEKLLREPPESAYTKDLLSGIQDMISCLLYTSPSPRDCS